jgi:hypothetical protein
MIFFVYQIVTKPLKTQPIPDEPCLNCGRKDGVELTLYMRYIAMGIPLFGMGRHTGVYCTNCGHVIKNPHASLFAKKKYSVNIANSIKEIRQTHKRTWWQLVYPWSIWFVLPVFILILMGITSINNKNRAEKAKEYKELLMNPLPGDIYKASWSQNLSAGVLVKVMRISGDTMYIVKTRKYIPDNFSKDEWDKLTADPGPFETKEYKITKFSALKDANYGNLFMYNTDEKGRYYPIYLGSVLNSKYEMDLDFETIHRKK